MERFSALVLSQDDDAIRVINRAFEEYCLEAKIVRNIRDANELVRDRRFDLAVFDCDLPGSNQLAYLEPGTAWTGMVFALVRKGQIATLRGRRIHLTLPKPLNQGLFSRGLRAAYTTMAHERRAAFRYPVDAQAAWAAVTYQHETRELGSARILNVSRSGMCVETRDLLPQRGTVRVAFELPDNGGLINAEGEVVWAKAPGKSGVRFSRLPASSQKRLTQWLENKLSPEFAGSF